MALVTPETGGTPGHKALTRKQQHLVQDVRAAGEQLDELIKEIESGDCDARWLALGRDDLQQGLMALVRSITRPKHF